MCVYIVIARDDTQYNLKSGKRTNDLGCKPENIGTKQTISRQIKGLAEVLFTTCTRTKCATVT